MQTAEKNENRLEKMIGIVAEKLNKKNIKRKEKRVSAKSENAQEENIENNSITKVVHELKDEINKKPENNLPETFPEKNDIEVSETETITPIDDGPEVETETIGAIEEQPEVETETITAIEEQPEVETETITATGEQPRIETEPIAAKEEQPEIDEEDENVQVTSEIDTGSAKLDSFFLSDFGSMTDQTDEMDEVDESVYIGFFMNNDPYAINVLQIKEITTIPEVSKMPNAPEFIEGVIELRKDLIPVIDLKHRFHMGKSNMGSEAKVLIIDSKDKDIGLIVESVTEVLRVDTKAVEKSPGMVSGVEKQYISGILNHDGQMTVILNLDKILSKTELTKLAQLEELENKKENTYSQTAPPEKGGVFIEV